MLIGAVADDITGATDLCLMLTRAGLRTVQVIGVPELGTVLPDADAVVIALKSRTIAAQAAVEMSVGAAKALLQGGAEQILFKYCSTFDSTDAGNIGPVTAALMDLTGTDLTIACPAFPANGRTVYQGHLFVGDKLLSDSPMKDHPLTPMRDANLVRVLGRQTSLPVGLVAADVVRGGVEAVRSGFAAARFAGQGIVITDALTNADLMVLGAACADMKLVTGGSGIAMGLARNFVADGKVVQREMPATMPAPLGRAVVLAGSCSAATLGQIAAARAAGMPVLALDATALADGRQTAAQAADWAVAQNGPLPPVIYSSADAVTLARIQVQLGREASGELVERTLANVAELLQARGFTRFLIAGGETSGAVVAGLGVQSLHIGPEIDPGVPWTRCIDGPDLALALKSGNFGAPDFFVRAWSFLTDEGAA
jgi:3-dehydrotetronate 4-kinase